MPWAFLILHIRLSNGKLRYTKSFIIFLSMPFGGAYPSKKRNLIFMIQGEDDFGDGGKNHDTKIKKTLVK